MRKPILLIMILVLSAGCAMSKHKAQIRDGFLTTGLNREAFVKVWGMPDRTHTMSSQQYSEFRAGASGSLGTATYFSGRVPLDVWVYEKWDVTLVFHGLRLVDWKTNKNREELRAISKQRRE